jgi:hypothetical protein
VHIENNGANAAVQSDRKRKGMRSKKQRTKERERMRGKKRAILMKNVYEIISVLTYKVRKHILILFEIAPKKLRFLTFRVFCIKWIS